MKKLACFSVRVAVAALIAYAAAFALYVAVLPAVFLSLGWRWHGNPTITAVVFICGSSALGMLWAARKTNKAQVATEEEGK